MSVGIRGSSKRRTICVYAGYGLYLLLFFNLYTRAFFDITGQVPAIGLMLGY